MKAVKIYKSEHTQPLPSSMMSPKMQITRSVYIAKIFELTHSSSEDISKISKESYTCFYENLKQRNQI